MNVMIWGFIPNIVAIVQLVQQNLVNSLGENKSFQEITFLKA